MIDREEPLAGSDSPRGTQRTMPDTTRRQPRATDRKPPLYDADTLRPRHPPRSHASGPTRDRRQGQGVTTGRPPEPGLAPWPLFVGTLTCSGMASGPGGADRSGRAGGRRRRSRIGGPAGPRRALRPQLRAHVAHHEEGRSRGRALYAGRVGSARWTGLIASGAGLLRRQGRRGHPRTAGCERLLGSGSRAGRGRRVCCSGRPACP